MQMSESESKVCVQLFKTWKKFTFTFQTPIHGNFQLQTFLESQMYSQYCEHQVRCDLLMINDL